MYYQQEIETMPTEKLRDLQLERMRESAQRIRERRLLQEELRRGGRYAGRI